MAEAVLKGVRGHLNTLIEKELGLFLGFDQDLERFKSLLTTIKATLEDAEERQFSERSIKDWLQKLKAAAHELNDIMDECSCEKLRLENEEVKCCLSELVLSASLSPFHPMHLVFRYKIAKRMKRVSERLDEIHEERKKFHLTERGQERRSGVNEWRQTSSIITERQVYGRKEDKDKIVDFLVGDASRFEDLSVYPIVGLGGLGKTTLAQLIYNHERVVKHFELRIWVCVSEDFSLKRMIKAIIRVAADLSGDDLDLEPLQRNLQNLLQRKRYLLVLDDVWDDEQENWQKLKSILACGAKGSSILIATRLSKVAAIMGTVPPHELSELSNNDCWELFKHRAFGPNEEENEELVLIGREIVKKCGGVPLAAIALGGLLYFKRKKNEWFNVKNSNLLELSYKENSLLSVLRLSYLNLPIKLRQCFAYCAIFPKDEIIRKRYLIELWIANGFISPDGTLDAEEVGDAAWNELYWRSFFQDIETDEIGKVKSFKMHDLVHDLAQSVAEEVCCITHENGVTTLFERIQHLSYHRGIYNSFEDAISIQLHKVKSLRTYFLPHQYGDQLFPDVLKCYSLRVLHLGQRRELSSSIGDLKHLRYLNLSEGNFQTLPESLGKLWNLQILKLDNCYFLQKLSNSLIHLKALQQLSLDGCISLSSLPPHIGNLNSLRILPKYFVGKERGFLLAELGPLKLKGDLDIKYLEKVNSVKDAEEANMLSKQLNKLRLSWHINDEELKLKENVEEILEVLQPDTQQLQSLWLKGYKGVYFPQWMSSPALKCLNCLQLLDCKSCKLQRLGKLTSLKNLRIIRMINVKYVCEECYDDGIAFMALEYLTLQKLPNLIRLSSQNGKNMFPRLSTLEVSECPKFLVEEVLLRGLHSLKKLIIEGCGKFNVSAGFQCVSCLEVFMIRRCRQVEGLHEALQHMTALKRLILWDVPNLESLPDCIGNLPLLGCLTIGECPKLMSLPTSLSLLNGLQYLTINGCPELQKRVRRNGEDWPKIAHIPHITVW